MKKYITIAALLAAGTACAHAAKLETLATMRDLVAASDDIGTSVSNVSENYLDATVYSFTGAGSILKINDSDLLSYFNGGTGFLTVAAWIKPTSTTENSVFSFGGQNDGVKFSLKGGKLQITTKGIADATTSLGGISDSDWTLVAWTLSLDLDGNNSRVYVGDGATNYSTIQTTDLTKNGNTVYTTWKESSDNDAFFAIGSGNSATVRDGYKGEIANLTVFKSAELPTNPDFASFMGSAPTPAPVPEPSAFGLLAGLGALALVGTRRRRK